MEVLTEITNNVLVITLNRPEAGNALNGALSEGLSNALNDAAENPEVRAIVITGAGEKVFCAGMDLKAFAAGEDIAKIGLGFAALRKCKKPLIAAVNGHALAGGFEVVLATGAGGVCGQGVVESFGFNFDLNHLWVGVGLG